MTAEAFGAPGLSRRARWLAVAGAVMHLALGLYGTVNALTEPTGDLASTAVGILYAAPGLFALAALRDRPAMLATAAMLGFVAAFTTILFVVLLVPAVLYVVAMMSPPRVAADGRGAVGVALSFLMVMGAAATVIATGVSRCASTATGSSCTSSTPSMLGFVATVGLVGAALLVGSVLTRHEDSGSRMFVGVRPATAGGD